MLFKQDADKWLEYFCLKRSKKKENVENTKQKNKKRRKMTMGSKESLTLYLKPQP
jgi:hypothetical protein